MFGLEERWLVNSKEPGSQTLLCHLVGNTLRRMVFRNEI